jgi:hypothetical protein
MAVELADAHLGTAAQLLAEQGDKQAAALLLDVQSIEYVFMDLLFPLGGGEGPDYIKATAKLLVEPLLVPHFTDEIKQQIYEALHEAALTDEHYIDDVLILPAPADENWRESLAANLSEKPINQARLGRPGIRWLHADRMAFRDEAEIAMYRALKRAQGAMPSEDAMSIVPNPALRLPGRTVEPDFLVIYRGRCGVIEVDGATHSGKHAADRSRDRLLEDAGIARIDRIDVQDAQRPDEADRFVRRFLRRLIET